MRGYVEPAPDRMRLWPQHKSELTGGNASPRTVRARGHALSMLTRDADADLADITTAQIRAFVYRGDLAPNSRKAYRSHCRAFYAWCVEEGLLEQDPAVRVKRIKVDPGVPNPIDLGALSRAVAEAEPRMRLWLMLMAYAGLRCCEVAPFRRDSIRDGIMVVTGKGAKQRAVPVHGLLAAELAGWPLEGYCFPGQIHPHVGAQYVSAEVNAYLAGKDIPWTAHKVRHRFATQYLDQTGDLMGLKDLLGHASVATTQNYTKVNPQRLAAAVAALDYGLPDAS